jgi:hypothetical protein
MNLDWVKSKKKLNMNHSKRHFPFQLPLISEFGMGYYFEGMPTFCPLLIHWKFENQFYCWIIVRCEFWEPKSKCWKNRSRKLTYICSSEIIHLVSCWKPRFHSDNSTDCIRLLFQAGVWLHSQLWKLWYQSFCSAIYMYRSNKYTLSNCGYLLVWLRSEEWSGLRSANFDLMIPIHLLFWIISILI